MKTTNQTFDQALRAAATRSKDAAAFCPAVDSRTEFFISAAGGNRFELLAGEMAIQHSKGLKRVEPLLVVTIRNPKQPFSRPLHIFNLN